MRRSALTGCRLRQVIAVLLCLESGLVLLALPWSALWDHNLLMMRVETLRPWLLSDYARGAVNGLGLLTLWVGLTVAADLVRSGSE